MTETSQRPWAAVARYPEADHDPAKIRAHFAAMVIAHDRALAASDLNSDEGARAAVDRHSRPAIAAFHAAAHAVLGAWTNENIYEAVTSWDTALEYAWQWVEAAGLDPDEIEAAAP